MLVERDRRASPASSFSISARPRITPSGFCRSCATVPSTSFLNSLARRSRAHCDGQALVGRRQLARALAHPLLQPDVGLVQLLVEDDVVEGDRQAAAEHLDQRAVGRRRAARASPARHDHLAAARGADVEHRTASAGIRGGGARKRSSTASRRSRRAIAGARLRRRTGCSSRSRRAPRTSRARRRPRATPGCRRSRR